MFLAVPLLLRRRSGYLHAHPHHHGEIRHTGYGLVRGPVAPRLERVAPAFGAASLLFGLWYAFSAIGVGAFAPGTQLR